MLIRSVETGDGFQILSCLPCMKHPVAWTRVKQASLGGTGPSPNGIVLTILPSHHSPIWPLLMHSVHAAKVLLHVRHGAA